MKYTVGERFLLDRRRHGWTQGNQAKLHMVRPYLYGMVERDEFTGDTLPGELVVPRLGRVHAHERCLIYRRRAGVSQKQVAKDLKRSRAWVNAMERGKVPCDDLTWYWEQ
jgi:transcriptional regulator with XRE-family HTH domain